MSGGRALLLFLGDGVVPPHGWLRLADGAVTARGLGTAGLLPSAEEAEERVVAIVPGEDVAVHWIDLPDLAPQQAAAAARLLASEVSAEPVERLHVAIGAEVAEGRAMALASTAKMAAWLGQAQALGFDPESVIPEPFLIGPAAHLRRWEQDGRHILRGPGVALAAEPALAALAAPGEAETLDSPALEGAFGAALAALPVDLRQGRFARRRRWRIDWALARRLAWLGLAILGLTLLIQLVMILRYDLAADQMEREVDLVASRALPRAGRIDHGAEQLATRLADLRGGGIGYSATAAAIFTAVRDSANVELGAFRFDSDGSVRLTALAASAADIAAFAQRLETQGFAVDSGEARAGGGRQIADIDVRPR